MDVKLIVQVVIGVFLVGAGLFMKFRYDTKENPNDEDMGCLVWITVVSGILVLYHAAS